MDPQNMNFKEHLKVKVKFALEQGMKAQSWE